MIFFMILAHDATYVGTKIPHAKSFSWPTLGGWGYPGKPKLLAWIPQLHCSFRLAGSMHSYDAPCPTLGVRGASGAGARHGKGKQENTINSQHFF